MDKLKAWWVARRPTQRRLVQLYTALLYNANVKGFIEGSIYTGGTKRVCVPGFNCYSCPGAVGACPLGSLQNAISASGARAPYYVLGLLLLFGVLLGRVICGFLCPVGLIQELLYKLKTPKIRKNKYTRALSYLKYVILAVFVVLVPIIVSVTAGKPLPAFCKYICPAGTLEGAVALLSNAARSEWFSMLGALFTLKFVIMILTALGCVFVFRAFCRFLCPLGAIYSLFARVALLGVRVDTGKCTDCGLCVSHCKLDIRSVGDRECVQCFECADVCPTKAISWKRSRITLRPNEAGAPDGESARKAARVKRNIAWAAALFVLAGALWYFNRAEDTPAPPAASQSAFATQSEATPGEATPYVGAPTGYAPGMLCPDFSVPVYNDGAFTLLSARGKVVVINFWATWCTPCINELPYFQTVYDKYAGDVEMVIIHSHLVTDDVPEFMTRWDYTLPFALDESGSVIESLGGSLVLPMTVVVDRQGIVVYNREGSINLDQLEALIAPLI